MTSIIDLAEAHDVHPAAVVAVTEQLAQIDGPAAVYDGPTGRQIETEVGVFADQELTDQAAADAAEALKPQYTTADADLLAAAADAASAAQSAFSEWEEARARQDAAIRDAHRGGHTPTRLIEVTGLSRKTIYKILATT